VSVTVTTVFLGKSELDSISGIPIPYQAVTVCGVNGGDRILTAVVISGNVTQGGVPVYNTNNVGVTSAVGLDVSGHFTEFSPDDGVLLQKSGIDLSAATILVCLERSKYSRTILTS
jgi:hypothetical protein